MLEERTSDDVVLLVLVDRDKLVNRDWHLYIIN